jgi:hypothetical protein
MNNSITLRDKLRLLIETDARPRSFELLSEEMRSKGAAGFRPLAFIDSLRLDLALFFHKYFAAALCTVLLLTGTGVWIAFSFLAPSSPAAVRMQTSAVAPNQSFAAAASPRQVSISTMNGHRELSSRSLVQIEYPTPANANLSPTPIATIAEETPISVVEPKELICVMPSMAFLPNGVGIVQVRLSDPPLDYSGLTASVSFEQPSIPANPEFAATNENDLNYAAGYRFDRYQEAGIGYSRHVYRQISSTTTAVSVYNVATGKTTVAHETTQQDSDDPISLPGIYYTFHASSLEMLGIEPFATAFASKPGAGFLWRASAGLEWNAWDNLNAVFTYSREQLNSAAYTAPESARNFFSFGFSYRLLP